MSKWRRATRQFYREQFWLLLLVLLFFVVGVILGSLGVERMPEETKAQLAYYLDGLVNGLSEQLPDRLLLLQESLERNLWLALALWLLGLTVIGMPVVLGLVLWRGFVLGFTVGFLVEQKSWQGMLAIGLGILPHNLFFLPALMAASALLISFSIGIVRGRLTVPPGGIGSKLVAYTFYMLLAALLMGLAGAVEGVLSPSLFRLLNTLWS